MAIERVELRLKDGIIDTPHLVDDVENLQIYLKEWWGVLPKDAKIDGLFGAATQAAVERFQSLRQQGNKFAPGALKINGVVDLNTWAELTKVKPEDITMINRNVPVTKGMPSGFPSVDQILDIAQPPSPIRPFAKKNLPLILNQCLDDGVIDRGQIAYVFASAEHESHFGRFMLELADGLAYEGRLDLGNTQLGDGPRFKGRGFVQITGRLNYTNWSRKLGIELVSNPGKTSVPEIASQILVRGMRDGSFTGFQLSDYISGARRDFVSARRIINALDRANDIAQIAESYFRALI
jgi:Putative peptidoglycan binding domain